MPSKRGYNNAGRASRARPLPLTLRELRVAADISLTVLADLSGISKPKLSQIEHGRLVAAPREADAIAGALGLPAGSLVSRSMLVHEEAA